MSSINLITRLRSGWTLLKYVRVGLGLWVFLGSLVSGQASGILLGAIFTAVSLLTDGICCAGVCVTPDRQKPSSSTLKNEAYEYEELGR